MKKFLFCAYALAILSAGWAAGNASVKLSEDATQTPVDETSKIVNPNFDEGTNGWTVNTGKIEVKGPDSNPVVTAYNYQVNISQHITGLTPGTYILKVQACSRYKNKKEGITDYESKIASGTAIPNEAYIFANGVEKKIKNIYEETSTYDFYNNLSSSKKRDISADDITMSNGEQIPYDSDNLSYAFATLGMYENEVEFTVAENGAASIGIKNELSGSGYVPYIGYDNFRLYRISDAGGGGGGGTEPEPDPEPDPDPDVPSGPVELYNLNAPAGKLVPICMPYAVKSSYFGQVYTIGSIQDGEAIIVPVDEVATGVPCVVKSNGASTITTATTNYNTKPSTFTLWDNTTMQVRGNFTDFSWNATDIYGNIVNSSDLTFVEGDLKNMKFVASIENNAAARYWAQHPDYKAEDASCIKNYYQLPVYNTSSRRDKPNPVLVPVYKSSSQQTLTYWRKADKSDKKTATVAAGKNVVEIYDDNFIPGSTYYYESTYNGAKGQFMVGGALRMMNIGTNVVNMRDMGGKKGLNGKYVRYGKMYRSAEFKGSTYNINTTEKNALVALGINAELDLRNTDGGTSRAWVPNLVNNDNYFYAQNSTIIANGPGRMYETSTINLLKREFEFLVANLRKGRAIQHHCRIGADRTGLFSFLTLGLLGVSEADILRDYETTSYSSAGLRTKEDGDGDSAASNYKAKVPTFRNTASTFVGAFENYFLNTLKVSQTDINDFRSYMLGYTPLPADIEQEEVTKITTQLNNVLNALKDYSRHNIGEGYGKYIIADQDAINEINEIKALIGNNPSYDKITSGALTYEQLMAAAAKLCTIDKKIAAYNNAYQLNMPQDENRFYIQSAATSHYIRPAKRGASKVSLMDDTWYWTTSQYADDDCAFGYFDYEIEDGVYTPITIILMRQGLAFAMPTTDGAQANAVFILDDGVVHAEFVPSVLGTVGKYNIKIGDYYILVDRSGNVTASKTATTDADLDLTVYGGDITTGVVDLEPVEVVERNTGTFNILGQPVGDDYKGIVIKNGKKFLQR